MNIVLFLGAGFSRHFGMPVMTEFFSYARDSPRLKPEEHNLIRALILESRRANSFVESSPKNLEDVLSLAVMRDRLGMQDSSRADQLATILRKIYTTYQTEGAGYWGQFDIFKSFLGFDIRSGKAAHNLSIVTTNYDLNIESALHRAGIAANLGFSWVQENCGNAVSHQNLYTARGGIPVFKLHGSANWYQDGNDASVVRVDGRCVQMENFNPPTSFTLPYPCVNEYHAPSSPIIVPPSFLKPNLAEPLGSIWRGAAGALRQANQIVFVGYSFPPSDTEMRYFLASALSDNADLERIRIVDPHADKIVARLRSAESRFGTHFRDFLAPQTNGWGEVRLTWERSA